MPGLPRPPDYWTMVSYRLSRRFWNRENAKSAKTFAKGRVSWSVAFFLIAVGISVSAAGEEAGGDGSGKALTVFASSGSAVVINGSRSVDMRSVGLRWSHRWLPKGRDWLHGNPTLSVELIPVMRFSQEPEASAPAFNVLYEHRMAPAGSIHPVMRVGAGILYASGEVPPGVTRLNFSLLVGIGLDIDLSKRLQLAPEYRFHHVSNANTGPINPGINAHTLVLGLTYKLR
jgi:hypothetical protein